MNRMKRTMMVFMCLAVSVSVFAGGGSQSSGGASGAKTARVGAKGSLPLATTKPELEVMLALGSPDLVSSYAYADNAFTKKVVDETGVQLKIVAVPSADFTQRANVMLSAGNYPQIIYNPAFAMDIEYYSAQGILTALDSYEPLSYPNIKAAFAKYPFLDYYVRAADGKMYALPRYHGAFGHTQMNGRIWYYMPWIRDTGRKVPETLDEFADFLRYVKNTDLNKNGKKDEVPAALDSGSYNNFITYIAKAFFPYVGNYALDSGRKIVEQYRDDNFRAALKYIAALYKEGLIPEDAFSMQREQFQSMVRSGDPVAGIVGETWINNVVQVQTERFVNYFYLPPLKTSSGQHNGTNEAPWARASGRYYITDKCKDPELAVALYDYLINWEVMISGHRGVKGIGWTQPDAGALGFDGKPARYKILKGWGSAPLNSSWAEQNPGIRDVEYGSWEQSPDIDSARRFFTGGDQSLAGAMVDAAVYFEQEMFLINETYSKWNMSENMFIPPYTVSSTADAQRIADIQAVLNPFLASSRVEFITGVRDINSDAAWNAYLAELDRLGSKELINIQQKYIK